MVITLSVIIWWILIGLVSGRSPRLVIPGRQHIGIIVDDLMASCRHVGGILNRRVARRRAPPSSRSSSPCCWRDWSSSLFTTRGTVTAGPHPHRSRSRYRRPAWRRLAAAR